MAESGRLSILLVEDEALIALAEKRCLEDFGYEVTHALNGAAAVSEARRAGSRYDAILMDIDLGPGIDGTEAASEILAEKDIPIIFLSSHAEPEIVRKTEKITSYGYVVKNSGMVILDASIKMALKLFAEKSERKEAERLRAISADILGVLNESLSLRETSKAILRLIKDGMGLDAVGIRLKDGDDFPYFSESGFDKEFLVAENSLLRVGETGLICKGPDGRASLECSCGLVLEGRCGPPSDSVTAGGSLWTNDSLATMQSLLGDDPRARPRDRCTHDGYKSIALIPIRVDGEAIGLLHLNDRRGDRFTPESIRFFEGLTASFGIAVERKRSDERLRAKESQYRLIAENAADVIWVLDPVAGRFTYVSPSVERLRGYTPAEVMSQPIGESLTPESLEAVGRILADNLPGFIARGRGTMSFVSEVDQPRKDGSVVHTEVTTTYLFNAEGKVEIVGVSRDVSDRRRAEKELEASVAKFKAVFENAPVGISIIDSDRRVLESNEALARIVRIDKEGLAAGAYRDRRYIREDGSLIPVEEFASYRAIDEGKSVRDVVNGIVMEDGKIVWTQVSAAPLGLPDNRVVVITQDITERKRAESEVERQLAEKETVLKEAYHRIKNNIASIEALLSLQAEASGEPAVRSALQESIARIQSTRVLYEKLLLSEDSRVVTTRGYIASLVDSLAAVYPDRTDVSIELLVDDIALGSKKMVTLGIVINELMTNAFKYAFKGRDGGRVSISLSEAAGRIELVVRDDGVGIGEDRVEAKGFGLSLVEMLAEQLDGAFSIESDSGTRATLRFKQ